MTSYRLFPSTNGPNTATAFGGNIISSVEFCVTAEAYFQGYWLWVCPSGGQPTSGKAALWQGSPVTNTSASWGLVAGSVASFSGLTSGWNFIPVTTPFALSPGGSPGMTPPVSATGTALYNAAIGINGPFPDTNHGWDSGGTYPNGITSGPLTAFSAPSGTMPMPSSTGGLGGPATGDGQGLFTTGASDPSLTAPATSSSTHDNLWVDVQVADYATAAPAGSSIRLWPGMPNPNYLVNADNTLSMSATAFTLSRSCTLDKIWLYSTAGATGLPTRCGIWDTGTQTEVPGTDNPSPSWSGAAGSGWVSVSYTGVTLPAGNYSVAYYNGSGKLLYYDDHNYFFAGTDPVGGATVGGPAWNGLSYGGGILTAPNVANGPLLAYDDSSGTKPGQSPYQPNSGAWVYPGEFEASQDWGESRWADVEVTPVSVTPGGPAYTASMASM